MKTTLVLPLVVLAFLGCAAERSPTAAALSPTTPQQARSSTPLSVSPVLSAQPVGSAPSSAAATAPVDPPPVASVAPPVTNEHAAPHDTKGLLARLQRADRTKGAAAWTKEGCSSCHGGATSDEAKHASVGRFYNPLDTDDRVALAMNTVREGVSNKRLTMPPHRHLNEATILNLLAYARSINKTQ